MKQRYKSVQSRPLRRHVLTCLAGTIACLAIFLFPTQSLAADCNTNGVEDAEDIAVGTSQDCNNNNVPDECDITSGFSQDCNSNNVPDVCDVQAQTSEDLNGNEIPDECEPDCNNNGILDEFDILNGTSEDCNGNTLPDECDISNGLSQDCNNNDVPDFCDRQNGTSFDCNGNGMLDDCEVAAGAPDCNGNIIPDECELDCNNNDMPDDCDLVNLTSLDCNNNAVPDECDIASGTDGDCNGNGRPDSCDAINPEEDCDQNGMPDICEILLLFEQSPELSPIGHNSPRQFVLVGPPDSGEDVTLDFAAIGDFAAMVEFVDVTVNGAPVGRVFEVGSNDCPQSPNVDSLVVDVATYNSALNGGDLTIVMTASAAVDATPVLCTPYIQVIVSYQAVTEADSDGNGIPDTCELGPCPADLTNSTAGPPDGAVDVFDLLELLSNWGTNGTGAAIANPSNIADVFDLLDLLAAWGNC